MNIFHHFAKKSAEIVGNSWSFSIACLLVITWLFSGPFFHYSDWWQLIANTVTNITAFIVLFLIQATQNRDAETIQLKLDELIRSHTATKKTMINLETLTDEQLKKLEEFYKKLSNSYNNEHA